MASPPPLTRIEVPFIDDLGVEIVEASQGHGRVVLALEDRHLNSWKVAHGGVLMTLLDVAMAIAGRSLDPDARGGVTVEMKTSFLQPAAAGSRLTATGRAFHRSTTMSFCDGEVRDERDRLVAKAMGTFKTIKHPVERRVDITRQLQPKAAPTDWAGEGGDAG